MAKSAGNFYTLRDLTARGCNPMAMRYLYISSHYRSKLNFTMAGLEAAQKTLDGLKDFLLRLKGLPPSSSAIEAITTPLEEMLAQSREEFAAEMDDDLNSPRALAAFFNGVREINRRTDAGLLNHEDGEQVIAWVKDLDRVMGLRLADLLNERTLSAEESALVEARNAARAAGDWAQADVLRDRLKALGIVLEDTPTGIRIKYI